MDRIDAMRVFVTALDEGSLAAAGRKLGHSAAAVTRAIGFLEKHVGTELLHRSTRFYNPAKERCTVRAAAREPVPFAPEEALVLVLDRGLERRPAGERWWKHETGEKVEVREGTVWALAFEPGEDAAARAGELAELKDRRHGLFANPHFQDWRAGEGAHPPWPWLERPRKRAKEDRP